MMYNSTMSLNEDNFDIAYTCGICESIFNNKDDLEQHPCFEGYNQYITDDNLYCYPQCENGAIVCKSLMADGTEAVITSMPRTKEVTVNSQHDSQQTTNFEANKLVMEEQLIDEVSRRPGLWNFKLPLTERSPQIKKKLWEEVFMALGVFKEHIPLIPLKRSGSHCQIPFEFIRKRNKQQVDLLQQVEENRGYICNVWIFCVIFNYRAKLSPILIQTLMIWI